VRGGHRRPGICVLPLKAASPSRQLLPCVPRKGGKPAACRRYSSPRQSRTRRRRDLPRAARRRSRPPENPSASAHAAGYVAVRAAKRQPPLYRRRGEGAQGALPRRHRKLRSSRPVFARQTKRSECASACQPEHHCAEEPGSAPSPGCSVQEITHHPKRQSGSRSSGLRVSTGARTFLSRHVAKAFVRRRLWLRRGAAAPPNPQLERLGRWLMCGLTSWPGARGLVCGRV
jgi:hypothetical protein